MKKSVVIILALLLVLTGCAGNIKDGVALLEAKEYEKAKDVFQEDIKEERHLADAYHGMGIACFELEEYEEAAEAFESALEQGAEETASICSFLGACYIETEVYDQALNAYEKALAKEYIAPELKQEIEFNLIAVYENMGNWDAAKKQMDKYVENYPDDTRVEKEAEFLETR